ncbi:related to cytochrome P450 2A12 [Rhynchosporium graminicola]|uniref:Related to cytochrome P450 2A12 n=1 Tax=Rhynchosporium graminicola TaxID=2792576 RepID=A0A1E1KVL8_9HELO|nr:related to cytochrome P450 2A12 [Rhynchosporium commune]
MAFLRDFSPSVLGFVAIAIFVICKLFIQKPKLPPGTNRIPGPKGIPLLGSVPDLPAKHAWLQFYAWTKQYGPICQVKLGADTCILLSDPKIVEDLLVKRAAKYSGRTHFSAIWGDCATDGHYLPLMTSCADHKRIKTFLRKIIASMPKERLIEVAIAQTKLLILDLVRDPMDFGSALERCCGGISSTLAWERTTPEIAKAVVSTSVGLLEVISPEAIQNKLPFLEQIPLWVPLFLQPWRLKELTRVTFERNLWLGQRAQTKARIENEKESPDEYSWTKASLKDDSLEDEEKAYAIGMTTLIASVLESSPIQGLIVALCMYPDWQKKGQDEVDTVCGDRMPNSDDIQNMPVVRALIREIFRWRSPVPFGVPHTVTEDDVYEGYHIAKGSIMFALECAMSRDEVLYPDASNFRPERWLDPAFPTYKEPLTHYPSIKSHSSFGWGRRQCLGLDYSEIVHMTIVATILWSCNIQKKIDEKTGAEIELPWMDYSPFVIVRPMPIPMDIVPRAEWKVKMMSSETSA